MAIDYVKSISNEHVGVWVGLTGAATGITDVGEPLADELNNTGDASGMLSVAPAISFNDWSFGIEASETANEPSLADPSSYEERGQANFGGSYSPFYPAAYHDTSNTISNLYDMIKVMGTKVDHAIRIDGDVDEANPAEDGDFVSVYRVQREGETNPFTPGESKRYTAGWIPKGEFAHCVVVGDHEITPTSPPALPAGSAGRIRGLQQGRDVTNYLDVTTSDPAVVDVQRGGFYKAVGSGTATITLTDPETEDTVDVPVTVS